MEPYAKGSLNKVYLKQIYLILILMTFWQHREDKETPFCTD